MTCSGIQTPGSDTPPSIRERAVALAPAAAAWWAEHEFLDDTVVVHGGFTPRETYQFDSGPLTWTRKQPTAHERFYSTTFSATAKARAYMQTAY